MEPFLLDLSFDLFRSLLATDDRLLVSPSIATLSVFSVTEVLLVSIDGIEWRVFYLKKNRIKISL